jgi:hypothetical protein
MGALAWSIAEPAPLERRRHQRVKVRLAGRFMRSDRLEFDCERMATKSAFARRAL